MTITAILRTAALTFALVLAGVVRPAVASCVCGEQATCEAWPAASDVFIATVAKIDGVLQGHPVAHLVVSERLKGSVDTRVQFEVGVPCSATFDSGETYLVYATRVGGKLVASICSRTKPLEEAASDLALIRALRAGRRPTSVFGFIERPAEGGGAELKPITVRASGARVALDLQSRDDAGPFEVNGLPPGPYELSFLQRGAAVAPPRHIVLAAGQCLDLGSFRLIRSEAAEPLLANIQMQPTRRATLVGARLIWRRSADKT